MPKVIVREIDNTKAVGATYSNFTVVIPGPVAKDHLIKFDSVADENHIYECSSISDFEEYIGKVASEEGEPAKEAEAPNAEEYAVGTASEKILVWVRSGYKFATAVENKDAKPEGKLVDEKYIYTYISDSDIQDLSNDTYWKDSTDGTGKVTKVTKIAIYLIEDEGQDAEAEKPATTGNRLAYLLVSLGYTILFKSTTNQKDLADNTYEIASADFWSPLADKSNYDFRYICLNEYKDTEAIKNAIKVAARWKDASQANWPEDSATHSQEDTEGRGDVTVLIDVDESGINAKTQSAAIKAIQEWLKKNALMFKIDSSIEAGKYAAIFAPYVGITLQGDKAFGDDTTESTEVMIPASIYYLACAAKAAETYAEWYPIAGYQRGISDWTITSTSLPLGDLAIQKLQPRVAWATDYTCRSVNIVTRIRTLNNQFYLWGSRTAHNLDDKGLVASHFLNIRQLCTTLKKDIYNACKKLTFAPNDELLWIDFKDLIRPTLEKMKADRGIKDYDIKRVTVSAKALMKAKIRIIPIEPVEDFNIGVYLEDSINGVIADVESDA